MYFQSGNIQRQIHTLSLGVQQWLWVDQDRQILPRPGTCRSIEQPRWDLSHGPSSKYYLWMQSNKDPEQRNNKLDNINLETHRNAKIRETFTPAIQSTASPSTRPRPLVTMSSLQVWSRLDLEILLEPMSVQYNVSFPKICN